MLIIRILNWDRFVVCWIGVYLRIEWLMFDHFLFCSNPDAVYFFVLPFILFYFLNFLIWVGSHISMICYMSA